VLTSVAYAI